MKRLIALLSIILSSSLFADTWTIHRQLFLERYDCDFIPVDESFKITVAKDLSQFNGTTYIRWNGDYYCVTLENNKTTLTRIEKQVLSYPVDSYVDQHGSLIPRSYKLVTVIVPSSKR